MRYKRRCASGRASTSPASLRTRRCFDTAGWLRRSCSTSSPTGRSPSRRRSRIASRRGSASTWSAASPSIRTSMPSQLYARQGILTPSLGHRGDLPKTELVVREQAVGDQADPEYDRDDRRGGVLREPKDPRSGDQRGADDVVERGVEPRRDEAHRTAPFSRCDEFPV